MSLISGSKRNFVVLAAIVLMALSYVGWTYTKIRASDPLVLVVLALSDQLNPIESRVVVLELKRKIETGEADGAIVLLDVLTVAPAAITDRENGAVGLADALLESVVNINDHGSFGLTPLHMAIAGNDARAVEYLIGRGADPAITTRADADTDEGLNAQEFMRLLEETIPGTDRSEVAKALRNDT